MTRIEIYINKERADIVNEDIHLRLNRQLWKPGETVTKQLEWSYSFDLPATPQNNRIFGNANVLSAPNKFHQRFECQVYADGIIIYNGTLIVNEYNGKEKKYNCNLVSVKQNTLEDIFGDEVLTDAQWFVPFSGVPTINEVNADETKKYFFPFVAYGAFQKWPVQSDEVANTYTPKHTIDGSNKFWVESFYPSLNMMETVKKLFEEKGYTVGGSAFQDSILQDIYCSTNLADEQSPELNVGSSLFGDVSLSCTFSNVNRPQLGLLQDLNFKYERVPTRTTYIKGYGDAFAENTQDPTAFAFNFDEIMWWNVLECANTMSRGHKEYIYDPGEHLIVAPATGWYTIKMDCDLTLEEPAAPFDADFTTADYRNLNNGTATVRLNKDLLESTPIELQLIKNYDSNIELIKGKKNVIWRDGNPTHTSFNNYGGIAQPNRWELTTCYPHEALYNQSLPSSSKDLLDPATSDDNMLGYVYRNKETMAYDPSVSTAFICGISTMSDGVCAVQKNGKSWSPVSLSTFKCLGNVTGYDKMIGQRFGTTTTARTNVNYNSYNTAGNTNFVTISKTMINGLERGTRMSGQVQCCVWLEKNDLIEPVLVQRAYDGEQKYAVSGTVNVHLRAIGNMTEAELRADENFNMYSQSYFPTELNLFNFTNKEMKKSDWINNVAQAFNLDVTTYGNNVDINVNKGVTKSPMAYAVNIDNRASSDDAIASRIDYPKQMAVKYKINTDEAGFENSVDPRYINLDTWKNYGDSGYTVIQLSDDEYATKEVATQTNFAYTWYDTFKWYDTMLPKTSSGWTTNTAFTRNIEVPLVAESKYFIESETDEEGFKHDGYGLTQRLWFRQAPSQSLYARTADVNNEQVWLSLPINQKNGVTLSYRDTEKSILTEYFNTRPLLSSNYVEIDVRLTAEEYRAICGGARVQFDSDIYYVSEIEGYDPTNENSVTLKLVKKTD